MCGGTEATVALIAIAKATGYTKCVGVLRLYSSPDSH